MFSDISIKSKIIPNIYHLHMVANNWKSPWNNLDCLLNANGRIVMVTNEFIHYEDFRVRSYETNVNGVASAQTICNYLQEVAGNHATKLGFGVDQLLKKNLTWMLSRLHVQFFRYPQWREIINIETWPSGKKPDCSGCRFMRSIRRSGQPWAE